MEHATAQKDVIPVAIHVQLSSTLLKKPLIGSTLWWVIDMS